MLGPSSTKSTSRATSPPVCKHRAAFYFWIGALSLTPEPEGSPPASAVCWECLGPGTVYVRDVARAGWPLPTCPTCRGAGAAPLAVHAAAFVAAACETCDQCGGPRDDGAVTDDAMQTVCDACVEVNREAAREALQTAIAADHAEAMRLAA